MLLLRKGYNTNLGLKGNFKSKAVNEGNGLWFFWLLLQLLA